MDQNKFLLEMIGEVSAASDFQTASMQMLARLLEAFRLDQAVLWELELSYSRSNSPPEARALFAVDSTRKILNDPRKLWISHSLVEQSLSEMNPVVYRDAPVNPDFSHKEDPGSSFYSGSKSITDLQLRNVVCLPLSREPKRVIFLASRKNIFREYSPEELTLFKVAANAAYISLQQFTQLNALKDNNKVLQHSLSAMRGQLLYRSEVMAQLVEEVHRLSRFNISILISGESGVGKEEIAKEIHRHSGRVGRFVAINCANLTETLLESELFGYTKGAFTGASQSKSGLFVEANQGTFFLDEIAELPFNLQAKLLRVLQERVVRPLGSIQSIPVDIRIISASHQNLENCIKLGKFREDLYYRIQEATVTIPPLRSRKEDIELLAEHFVTCFCRDFGFNIKEISTDALRLLAGYSWPGNIRELKNICRTAVVLSRNDVIEPKNLRFPVHAQFDFKLTSNSAIQSSLIKSDDLSESQMPVKTTIESTTKETLDNWRPLTTDLKSISRQIERNVIRKMLLTQNQAEVAKTLGISVRTLQRILYSERSACP